MSITLLSSLTQGATINISGTAALYYPCGTCAIRSTTTEANIQVPYRTAGTFSKMYINVTTNTVSGADSIISLRNNGVSVNNTITIPQGTTGEFEDTSNTDTIIVGDLINYQALGGGGTGSFTHTGITILFDVLGEALLKFISNQFVALSPDSIISYFPLPALSFNQTVASDANSQFKYKTSATLKNMAVLVYGNSRITNNIFNSRINSANGNITITIIALTTGLFEDSTNTDTINIDDLVNYAMTSDIGGGTLQIRFISLEVITTNDKQNLISGTGAVTGSTQLANETKYIAISGGSSGDTTEIYKSCKTRVSFGASNLECYLYSNSVTATSIITLRKNGVDKTQTISIPSTTTGYFEDTTNTDYFYSTDTVNYKIVVGSSGTNLLINTIGMLVDYAALPPPNLADAIFFAGD